MKACKDCRYCITMFGKLDNYQYIAATCNAGYPRSSYVDLIIGETVIERERCDTMRSDSGLYGVQGNLFEPRLTILDKVKGFFKNILRVR